MYTFKLKFDCQGDPPAVYVVNSEGTCVLEVLEDPTPLTSEWSFDPSTWHPGPFACKVLQLLNGG
jgi:hypothetical protein